MTSRLNIKSDDAYRLASRLAALTGESLTSVVTKALRSELERQENARDVEAEVERMLAMGREIRSHMTEPVSSDLSGLYDEREPLLFKGDDFSQTDIEPALKD
jgi:antitoxin VapB